MKTIIHYFSSNHYAKTQFNSQISDLKKAGATIRLSSLSYTLNNEMHVYLSDFHKTRGLKAEIFLVYRHSFESSYMPPNFYHELKIIEARVKRHEGKFSWV